MALADLVLEGLTLILVIALGAVLIGGLTYLAMSVVSANNARLAAAGTYVYLPGPVFINGTIYVPMYNIGKYTVSIDYVIIKDINGGLHKYPLNLVLSPGQYYVYELTINYDPTALTIIASPLNEPRLALEFNANITTPGTVPLTPLYLSSGSGLITVTVNDPYGAGWSVDWSYNGQSFSVDQSQSYTWYINPPYVPIQISFQASITSNPSGYTCQIQPSSVTSTYGPGSTQEFTVSCSEYTPP
ncbi:MAG: hypothetical protein ACP5NQ_02240, partial [Vulcanisaeta sp.]